MPRDLSARRHGSELVERELERLLHQAANGELPVGEAILRIREVVGVLRIGRAVRLELGREIGLGIFARQRLRAEQRALCDAGELFRRIEHALDPRLMGEVIAAAEQRRARGGEPAREEPTPVERSLPAHDFSSAGSIT